MTRVVVGLTTSGPLVGTFIRTPLAVAVVRGRLVSGMGPLVLTGLIPIDIPGLLGARARRI